tara:strand:+ start:18799 stop:20220 length:1422 start_codon:yes stop_codon:yes gene_type:complete
MSHSYPNDLVKQCHEKGYAIHDAQLKLKPLDKLYKICNPAYKGDKRWYNHKAVEMRLIHEGYKPTYDRAAEIREHTGRSIKSSIQEAIDFPFVNPKSTQRPVTKKYTRKIIREVAPPDEAEIRERRRQERLKRRAERRKQRGKGAMTNQQLATFTTDQSIQTLADIMQTRAQGELSRSNAKRFAYNMYMKEMVGKKTQGTSSPVSLALLVKKLKKLPPKLTNRPVNRPPPSVRNLWPNRAPRPTPRPAPAYVRPRPKNQSRLNGLIQNVTLAAKERRQTPTPKMGGPPKPSKNPRYRPQKPSKTPRYRPNPNMYLRESPNAHRPNMNGYARDSKFPSNPLNYKYRATSPLEDDLNNLELQLMENLESPPKRTPKKSVLNTMRNNMFIPRVAGEKMKHVSIYDSNPEFNMNQQHEIWANPNYKRNDKSNNNLASKFAKYTNQNIVNQLKVAVNAAKSKYKNKLPTKRAGVIRRR